MNLTPPAQPPGKQDALSLSLEEAAKYGERASDLCGAEPSVAKRVEYVALYPSRLAISPVVS